MVQDSGNVLVYVDDNGKPQVDVRFQDEMVWLTQAQLVDLYQSSKANVSEHIKNIFDEGELDKNSVVRKFRTTASDGKNYEVNYYNLDMIISLGYHVDSDKPFAGMTNFKGKQPTQAEAMVAKNYLSQKELKVLNNLVSAYFDIAEINAHHHRSRHHYLN